MTRNNERQILKSNEIPADFNRVDWQFGIFPCLACSADLEEGPPLPLPPTNPLPLPPTNPLLILDKKRRNDRKKKS